MYSHHPFSCWIQSVVAQGSTTAMILQIELTNLIFLAWPILRSLVLALGSREQAEQVEPEEGQNLEISFRLLIRIRGWGRDSLEGKPSTRGLAGGNNTVWG